MAIHFTAERMKQVYENHARWWKGELDRPLVKITVPDAYPEIPTEAPSLSQATCMDLQWTPEQVIDATDAVLSRQEYLGDAFPFVNFDAFGPGVVAAFAGGARMDNSSGNVWFFPDREREIEDIHVAYDPDNDILRRIKALYRAGLEKWKGAVIMGMPDLGGVMDVAATLRGSQNLLMDVIEAPEEVVRLCAEIQAAWYEAYEDVSKLLWPQVYNSCWSGLLSKPSSYVIQCDFSYMISGQMFREFAMDTLRNDTRRISHLIYHLDGIGALRHLDDLLTLEQLDAIQWVFGAGQPQAEHWLDVYRKIEAAGKQYQICGEPENNLNVIRELHGSPYITHSIAAREEATIRALLEVR